MFTTVTNAITQNRANLKALDVDHAETPHNKLTFFSRVNNLENVNAARFLSR